MTTALLISTYNWPEALELVLKSVKQQSTLPNEVVIADDGSTSNTKSLIDAFKEEFSIPIKHIWHEDVGFTKTVILNKAFQAINSDYIIQIDGDIILHKHFVKNHIQFAKKNTFLFGSRISLTETYSKKVLEKKQIKFNFFKSGLQRKSRMIYFPLINIFNKPKNKPSRKLRGCNISYWKTDAFAINGYNEDFVGWGYEDFDFALRLLHNGVLGKRIKHAAIQFHIYHKEAPKGDVEKGNAIQSKTFENRVTKCKNGIKKL